MQKKLLLLCMTVACAMIQAREHDLHNKEKYADYRAKQIFAYQSALINSLSGDDQAINEEDKKNDAENNREEESLRKEQYDGILGYLSTEPTEQSKVGRKFKEYAQCKQVKKDINKNLSENANKNKEKFSKEILPDFKRHLELDRYFINTYCLEGLKECRENIECYDSKGLSPTILTNPDFGSQREQLLYICVAKFSSERNVHVTPEELRMIAEHNPTTQIFFTGIQDGIKDMTDLREEILNPKKELDASLSDTLKLEKSGQQ